MGSGGQKCFFFTFLHEAIVRIKALERISRDGKYRWVVSERCFGGGGKGCPC